MSEAGGRTWHWLLPALVLVAVVAMFVLFQTGYTPFRQSTPCEESGFVVPEHHIPLEYFRDSKPATPQSESAMITIVISEETYDRFSPADKPGIVVIPVAFLDFTGNFTNTTLSSTMHLEKSLRPEDGVVMIQMPVSMYKRFLAGATGPAVELPASSFVRRFDNLSDLQALVGPDGSLADSMNTGISPGETMTIDTPIRTPPTVIITTPRLDTNPPCPQAASLSGTLVMLAIGSTVIAAARDLRRKD
ncbi:MAG: hypothetical protein WC379_14550 [Methanoregula sp.]|jgi:hypothetical protein